MNLKRDTPIIALAVIIIAVVVIGELNIYTNNGDQFSADSRYDSSLSYSVNSSIAKDYSVLAFDNALESFDKCYIYYDTSYPGNYEKAKVPIGAKTLDQDYYVSQLSRSLDIRCVDHKTINAIEMKEIMESGLAGNRTAIIAVSGALPSNVYNGTDNLALSWIEAGGRLYWVGNALGAAYAEKDEIVEVENGASKFFGAECLNTSSDDDHALSEGNMCQELCLLNNRTKFAVSSALLPSSTNYKDIGFVQDGYSSICMVGKGNGMICVFGGVYSNNQRNDVAQVVASGMDYGSVLIGIAKGTVNGSLSGNVTTNGIPDSAYIFMGGYYPVYGKRTVLN